MNGWTEWALLMILMVAGGVAVAAFFTNPLLGIVVLAALLVVRWLVQPAELRDIPSAEDSRGNPPSIM